MAHFFIDDVIDRTYASDVLTGQEMRPIYGPQLPSRGGGAAADDVYGDYEYAVQYPTMHYSAAYSAPVLRWDARSSAGFVGLETKVSHSYLTGVLQCLFHCQQFRELVLSWPYEQFVAQRLHDPGQISANTLQQVGHLESSSVVMQLQRMFARLQLLEERSTKTSKFLKALGLGDTTSTFGRNELDLFLDRLFERMQEEFRGTGSTLETRLDDLTKIRFKTVFTCLECQARSESFTDKRYWMVNVRETHENGSVKVIKSLDEGLQSFFAADCFPRRCENCGGRETDTECSSEIVQAPDLMFVIMRRFMMFPELGRRSKVRERITFPKELTIEAVNSTFDLTGFMVHTGASQQGMHYAILKPMSRETWCRFADTDVEEIPNLNTALDAAFGRKDARQEDDECAYMLVYRKRHGDSAAPLRIPSPSDVPQWLRDDVEDEHRQRSARKRRKAMERDMQRVRVTFNGEVRELRIHGTQTMGELEELAAQTFGIDKIFTRSQYRLRVWDETYGIPKESFGYKLRNTVGSCRLYPSDMLRLETLPSDKKQFIEYDNNSVSVKVHVYDGERNTFGPIVVISMQKRSDTLITMKKVFESELGIPHNQMRIFKESVSNYDGVTSIELLGDDEEIGFKLQVWDGCTLYVEHSDADPTDPSPCQAEIDRVKNRIFVTYQLDGTPPPPEITLEMDKRNTLHELKSVVAKREGLDFESLKVFQLLGADVRVECKNEDQPLSDVTISSNYGRAGDKMNKLIVQQCVRKGLQEVRLNLLQVVVGPSASLGSASAGSNTSNANNNNNSHVNVPAAHALPSRSSSAVAGKVTSTAFSFRLEHLWSGVVNTAMSVADLKQVIRTETRLSELGDVAFRVREIECGRELGAILPENRSIKDASSLLFDDRELAVEILRAPDVKTDKSVVISVFLLCADWTFVGPHEVALGAGAAVDDLYGQVAALFQLDISVIGVAKATSALSVLDAPQLDWDPKVPSFVKNANVPHGTVETAPFYLRDGDVLIVRNNTEEMEALSDEKIGSLKGIKKI
jgi:ubiquitin C-terminal hydrolase